MRFGRTERGAAAVETSLILSLLLLVALGAFEWGMAFREWSSVTSGSREGTRVAAAAGDESGADCIILEATAGALLNQNGDTIRVEVFEWLPNASPPRKGRSQIFRPSVASDLPASLICGTWVRLQNNYPAAVRDNQGAARDWIGVEVQWDYAWITGFMWFNGTVCNGGLTPPCWSQDTKMHIEPDPTP